MLNSVNPFHWLNSFKLPYLKWLVVDWCTGFNDTMLEEVVNTFTNLKHLEFHYGTALTLNGYVT